MWGSDLDLAYGPDDALAPHEATSDLVVVRPMCSLLAATGQARTPVSVCGVYALNAGAANVGPLSVKGVGALNVLGPANVSGLGGNGLFAANALVASPFVGSASGVVAFNAIVGAPHVFGATGIAVFNVLAGSPIAAVGVGLDGMNLAPASPVAALAIGMSVWPRHDGTVPR